jgi:hypothetical protein
LVQDPRAPSLARWLRGIAGDAKLCAYALSDAYCCHSLGTNTALSPVCTCAGTGCHSRSLPALYTHAGVTHANHRRVWGGRKIRRTCSLRLSLRASLRSTWKPSVSPPSLRLCLPGTTPKHPPAHRGRRHVGRRQSVDRTAQSRRGGHDRCDLLHPPVALSSHEAQKTCICYKLNSQILQRCGHQKFVLR